VIATLTFAPLVIWLFYTPKFAEAVDVLRWICLGIAIRVVTWPMGYIIVAKNKRALFLGADFAWTVVNLGLTWMCVKTFGLNGAGIAFFGSYLFHALMIYPIARWLSGFRWSPESLKTGCLIASSTVLVFGGFYLLPPVAAVGFGVLTTTLGCAYSARMLINLVSPDRLPHSVRRLLTVIGPTRRGQTKHL
jgi:PST family polysaccharide transporter